MPLANGLLLIAIIFLTSCQPEVNESTCLEWYTKSFKGHPPSANKFKEHCQTPQLRPKLDCQKAFNKLMMGQNEEQLKAQFGSYVMNCFNERELKKHLQK